MAEKQSTPIGPAGGALKENIRRIRESQRMTYVELADRLAKAGRPIPVLGLRRIERGERRVDVDDLLTLAHALNAHPVDLLVPAHAEDEEPYAITPELTTTVARARDWIGGTAFLVTPETPMDFAHAIQSMPKERAQAASRNWFTPERQQDWVRQTNRALQAEAEDGE